MIITLTLCDINSFRASLSHLVECPSINKMACAFFLFKFSRFLSKAGRKTSLTQHRKISVLIHPFVDPESDIFDNISSFANRGALFLCQGSRAASMLCYLHTHRRPESSGRGLYSLLQSLSVNEVCL